MSETIASNAIALWKTFPSLIRDDSCFSLFRDQVENGETNKIDQAKGNSFKMCSSYFETKTHAINVDGSNAEENLLEKTLFNGVNNEEKLDKKSSKKWKYIIFFGIWLLSAWHLLTVKEKMLIKHDILIDSQHTKSKIRNYIYSFIFIFIFIIRNFFGRDLNWNFCFSIKFIVQ